MRSMFIHRLRVAPNLQSFWIIALCPSQRIDIIIHVTPKLSYCMATDSRRITSNILQLGSVSKRLSCGTLFTAEVDNEKFRKAISFWRSYVQTCSAIFFWLHRVVSDRTIWSWYLDFIDGLLQCDTAKMTWERYASVSTRYRDIRQFQWNENETSYC